MLKIDIVNHSTFNVLVSGHIFVCSEYCGEWEIYEVYPFLEDNFLKVYTCSSRLDCINCIRFFYTISKYWKKRKE